MRRAGSPRRFRALPITSSTRFSRRCRTTKRGRRLEGADMSTETILVEQRGAVTLVTLNRPQALNALNGQILSELLDAIAAFDKDASQGCAVITGSEKAFAAGADIKEMERQGFA